MRYNISLSDDGTYLRVQALEAITGELAREFAKKAIEEAKQQRVNKFLVDVRGASNVSGTMEQYDFGYKDMALLGLDRLSKIAILANSGDQSHNFIATSLSNAGYRCSLFADEALALKWLLE